LTRRFPILAAKTVLNVKQNIIFFILVKAIAFILITLGFEPMWLAIFADVGVTIIATLNATRTMHIKE
jgi:Cd2+/Zn2+-exporting ATPase